MAAWHMLHIYKLALNMVLHSIKLIPHVCVLFEALHGAKTIFQSGQSTLFETPRPHQLFSEPALPHKRFYLYMIVPNSLLICIFGLR